MIIRIMRHGDAPMINGERQLSSHGVEEVKQMGHWLQSQEKPELVLVSPILRAQQTFNSLKSFLIDEYQVKDENLLRPETDATIACHYFESLEADSLLLISHMPFVTNLLEAWLPGRGKYFPTAAIAELEIANSKAKLLKFVQPSDLL